MDDINEMKIKSVTISGGECMYHPHFVDYLRILKNMGLRVKLLTNLTLLNDEIINILKTGLFLQCRHLYFLLMIKYMIRLHRFPGHGKRQWQISNC